jgi:hypothetical protein
MLMHYLLPLDHTCGVFNALERVITCYRDYYTWWLGPCDDMAPSLDVSLRSACFDEPTRASSNDFIYGMTHACGGHAITCSGCFSTFGPFP